MVQAEALAGPSRLSLRGVDEHGHVAPDQIAGLGVPYRPGQRVVAHGDGGAGVAQGHRRQGLVDVVGGQFAQPHAADGGQDRGEDVLVLLDRLGGAAVQALREPIVCGTPDRVVRLRPDPCFDVAVEGFEPVLNDGLGLAGDLAPDPPAVRVVPEADDSSPPAVAVPVAVAVTARRIVLEEDSVFAPSAS